MIQDTMINGEEYEIGWTFKIDSTTPKDLTGYSVLVQIRPSKNSTTVIDQFTEVSSELTFVPVDGTVDLLLPPSLVRSYTFTSAVVDCLVYDALDTDGDRSEPVFLTYCSGVSRL